MADRVNTKRDIAWIAVLEEIGAHQSVTPHEVGYEVEGVDEATVRGVCKTMEQRGWLERTSERGQTFYPTAEMASIVIPATANTLGQQ